MPPNGRSPSEEERVELNMRVYADRVEFSRGGQPIDVFYERTGITVERWLGRRREVVDSLLRGEAPAGGTCHRTRADR